MSTATKILMIATVWFFAALVLFKVGMWVGSTNKWDGCDVVYRGPEIVRVCEIAQ